jgi:DNA-binding NtrC family response regulator
VFGISPVLRIKFYVQYPRNIQLEGTLHHEEFAPTGIMVLWNMRQENVSRPRVLVVEDEAIVRLDVTTALSDAGFDVIEVASADDALAILSVTSDVEVVITDIELNGSMDGLKLAWAIRDRWPPVQLVVVSAQRRLTDADLPEHGRFFAKPYNVDRLVDAVRNFISA